jgi:di/tricarboxylate transporter
VSLLWCTEALPLYVTAMLVPLLAVVLRVMMDRSGDGGAVRLSAQDAAPAVFKAMFSQARPPLATAKPSTCSESGRRCPGSGREVRL